MKHLSIYSLCFLLLLSFAAGCKDKQVEISPDATSDEEGSTGSLPAGCRGYKEHTLIKNNKTKENRKSKCSEVRQ